MTHPKLSLLFLLASLASACGDTGATMPPIQCDGPSASSSVEATTMYLDAWNEDGVETRVCGIQRSLAEDVTLTDEWGASEGRDEVSRHLDAAIEVLSRDGISRELDGPVVHRHSEALVHWSLVDLSGSVVARGQDWLEFDDDGLLRRVQRFAGAGVESSVTDALLAWENAWNTRDEAARSEYLGVAATEDVRFTDLLTDVAGRASLGAEIQRQQGTLDGELVLGKSLQVFAGEGERVWLVRQTAQMVLGSGGALQLVNYARLRDGRIERMSGFPDSSL